MSGIDRSQRWRKDWPCQVCGGWPDLPQGRGIRCTGYLSTDGKYLHCSREERSYGIEPTRGSVHPTYAHRVADGDVDTCRCGSVHLPSASAPTLPAPRPMVSRSAPLEAPRTVGQPQRWTIHDVNGRVVAVHERMSREDGSKKFSWLHPDGRWSSATDPLPVSPTDMLYGLPGLAATQSAVPVVMTEGEKAADALLSLKVPNVAVVGIVSGAPAGVPSVGALAPLRGRRVYLWPDRDDVGVRLMRSTAERLREVGAAELRMILWGKDDHDDAADFVARGGRPSDLIMLARSARPAFTVMTDAMSEDDPSFSWDTVELRDIEYLWEPRIPLRKVTILAGMPGIGKSFIVSALAAAVTVGHGLPDMGAFEPRTVVFCSREDDIDDTLGPRVKAMGGDLSRMRSLKKAISFDRRGLETLDTVLRLHHPQFLIFDTLSAFAADLDMKEANEMRHVFTGLRDRCYEHNLSIMLLTHFNKSGGSEALLRILGSVDIVGAARSVLITGKDPMDKGLRHLLHAKINAGWEAGGLCYRITRNSDNPSVADFMWCGPSAITEAQLLGGGAAGSDPAVHNAIEVMRVLLARGSRNGEDMREALKRQGVSMNVIGTACTALGIQYAGYGTDVMWSLPTSVKVSA